MSSMSISSYVKPSWTLKSSSSFPSHEPQPWCCIRLKTSLLSVNSRTANSRSRPAIFNLKTKPISRIHRPPPSAAAEAVSVENPFEDSDFTDTQQSDLPPGVTTEVKEAKLPLRRQAKKPRPVLKFLWMEKNIGIGLDQLIPGHGTVPLSPYFFWPRKDAWEELKAVLESKPSISQKKMIILLNQATDIINLWQQSGGSFS